MSRDWYVRLKDGELGPLSSRELKQLVAAGKLHRDELVSPDNVRWVPAAKVKGLVFDVEVAPSRLQGSQKLEVNKISSKGDQRDNADGELIQLLFSNRRQLLSRRFAAWVIDSFVISLALNATFMITFIACVIGSIGLDLIFYDPLSHGDQVGSGISTLFGPAIGLSIVVALRFAVPILFQRDAGYSGLGKCFLGIMAVDNSARPCTPDRSFRRNFLLLLPAMPLVEGVVLLKRKDSRRLGDLMAGTSVVQEYLPFLEQVISSGQQDTIWKVAYWILRTEMHIPDKNLKKRDPHLLRMFRHIVQRQKLVCERLVRLDRLGSAKADVLRDLQVVLDEELTIFRKISHSFWSSWWSINRKISRRWSSDCGLKTEHIQEFHSLQQKKLGLVAKL